MNILSFSLTITCITIFLAIQSLHLTQAFSQIEDSQIEETCKKYSIIPNNGTERCVAILNAIRDRKHDDPKIMALLGMEFAALKLQETIENIKKMLKDKSIKPRYYRALRTCIKRYNDGSYSFGFGILAFKEGKYDNVNYRGLKSAFDDVFECERELNKAGVKGEDFGIKTEFILDVSDSAKAAFDFFINKQFSVNNLNKQINGNKQEDVKNNNL